jgi:hypothetical protein
VTAGARFVGQPIEPPLGKALAPCCGRHAGDPELLRDGPVAQPLRRQQHDLGPQRVAAGYLPTAQASRQFAPLGLTALFAALDGKGGTVIDKCMPRRRAAEFRRFLDTVEARVPAKLGIHVVVDNAAGHKAKLIRNWFAKRPRWHVDYTPTSASWINQVERFFALLNDGASGEARTAPPPNSRPPSLLKSTPTTPSRSRSAGPRAPTTSSPPSSGCCQCTITVQTKCLENSESGL